MARELSAKGAALTVGTSSAQVSYQLYDGLVYVQDRVLNGVQDRVDASDVAGSIEDIVEDDLAFMETILDAMDAEKAKLAGLSDTVVGDVDMEAKPKELVLTVSGDTVSIASDAHRAEVTVEDDKKDIIETSTVILVGGAGSYRVKAIDPGTYDVTVETVNRTGKKGKAEKAEVEII